MSFSVLLHWVCPSASILVSLGAVNYFLQPPEARPVDKPFPSLGAEVAEPIDATEEKVDKMEGLCARLFKAEMNLKNAREESHKRYRGIQEYEDEVQRLLLLLQKTENRKK